MNKPDAITYVPRRVYDAARRLEAACKRVGCPSEISVAEYRSDNRPTRQARVFWHQVWCLLMEEECIPPDFELVFVVVDDPAFDRICSTTPDKLN